MAVQLTESDHELLDQFLATVLDRYKDGEITKSEAIGNIAHLVAAVDLGKGAGDNPAQFMRAILQRKDR